MTEKRQSRQVARRVAMERDILDAAWAVMARQGVAALSVREVARSVGLRQQSLTHYFPTKQALLDALFADGFDDLRHVLEQLPTTSDVDAGVVAVTVAVVDYCVANPARYHLMLQRTLPGFEPSDDSHRVALACLNVLVERLAAAGVTGPSDIALARGLISGLAAEQIANEPHGRAFADQAERGIRLLLAAMPRADQQTSAARATGTRRGEVRP